MEDFDNLISLTPTGDFIPRHCRGYLLRAFDWITSEEGDPYWWARYRGAEKYTEADRTSLIHQGLGVGATTKSEDIWL
jgi:hypothetical protein